LGDPKCPHCHGLGYLRRQAEPGSPDFGKLEICSCRQGQVSQLVRQRLFELSDLKELEAKTFENFQSRGHPGLGEHQANSLETAFNHARLYAQSMKGWLVLQGGTGSGKTHLAAAIANFAVGMGVGALFLTVPDMLDKLRTSFDSEETTFEERFNEIRNSPLLVLDDFGTQNQTAWAQEKLFQIMNHRYINKLPVVVTTNLDVEDIEARIRSRLMDPELVTKLQLFAPDYRNPLDDKGHPELSSLGVHGSQTFASFDSQREPDLKPDEVRSLEKAIKLATAYANRPRGWLVITGPYGCGKTHLAAAIANSLMDKGKPPLFIMVLDLLDHLRSTFSPSSPVSYDRRFDDIRMAPVLILDDLGAQSTTQWAREKLYQILNHRYNAELPTVITIPVEALESIDERLRVRLMDERLCTICQITAPAYHGSRTRKAKK
jgi:DNA replication protein DnaC